MATLTLPPTNNAAGQAAATQQSLAEYGAATSIAFLFVLVLVLFCFVLFCFAVSS